MSERVHCQYLPARLLFIAALVFGMPLTQSHAETERPHYLLAVVPQSPPSETYKHWKPLVRYLNEKGALRLQLKIYPSIPEFEAGLRNGVPDFAYMNPYHQVMARQWQGYDPLVRDNARQLSGVLVVHAGSDVQSVDQLQDAIIAFPAPNAFGASLYMRALLKKEHKLTFVPRYVATHGNVYRHVIVGQADAGGGVRRTFDAESPSARQQLRVLFETPGVAPHPISAHPRVAPADQALFTDSVLGLLGSAAGQDILKSIQMREPVRASFERDYAPLKSLDLQEFVVPAAAR